MTTPQSTESSISQMDAGAVADVDVIIPTVGRWDLLDQALASIEEQINVTTRAIVVNDSGGPAPPWLNFRCTVVTTPGRTGEGSARDAGLEAATAKYVAFCDDDDVWLPTKLRLQLHALDGELGWCVCGAVETDRNLDPTGRRSAGRVAELVGSGELLRDLLCHNSVPAGSSTVVVSTDLLRDVGGWDPELSFFADWECWIRLASAVDPVVVDQDLALYRHWGGQLISDRSRGWGALRYINDRHSDLRNQHGVSRLDDRVVLWILAGELRTPGRRWIGLRRAASHLIPRRLSDLNALPRHARLVVRRVTELVGRGRAVS